VSQNRVGVRESVCVRERGREREEREIWGEFDLEIRK